MRHETLACSCRESCADDVRARCCCFDYMCRPMQSPHVVATGSLEAVYELVVHFDSLKNIDLFRQGLYHLRASFYVDRLSSSAFSATPVTQSSGSSSNAAGGVSRRGPPASSSATSTTPVVGNSVSTYNPALAHAHDGLSALSAHTPEVLRKRFRFALPYHMLVPSPACMLFSSLLSLCVSNSVITLSLRMQ
jgi:hypothetical protein